MTTAVPPIVADSPAPERPSALQEVTEQAAELYTLPAVAMEVLQLTDRPDVDATALKDCIERDPALTAKILRVVNSSLFGLSGEVSNLNQAVALLGDKPLKLLVLGFSLPEELFAEVAGDQLEYYWRMTLARAVAAREISEDLFNTSGDDAFLAALLQDLGVLVLLCSVGQPYAEFHRQAVDDCVDLADVEQQALGFNHIQLSAALLAHWRLPSSLIDAIVELREIEPLSRSRAAHAGLARTLHLADLLSQLVVGRRLNVLPELMEAGDAYCKMTKPVLHELVEHLQEKVDDLAEILSVSAPGMENYTELLAAAQKRIVTLMDEGAAALSHAADRMANGSAELAGKTAMLQIAVASMREPTAIEAEHPESASDDAGSDSDSLPDFDRQLTLVVGDCRGARQPVSAACLAVEAIEADDDKWESAVDQLLNVICRRIEIPGCVVQNVSRSERNLLLPGCERHEAVAIVDDLLSQVRTLISNLQSNRRLPPCVPSAGVASVGTPPKNFPPQALLETARRCQAAAGPSGGVKSLEIC